MTRLSIPDLHCGHCAASVERAVKALDPAATVQVDIARREADVATSLDIGRVCAQLEAIGFPAQPV